MSGLEALSLAANIIEIISFAGEVTRLCKSVYINGRLEPQLGILAVSLEAIAKEAQAHQANLVTKTDIDLRLEEMASKWSKQGDLIAAVRVAVKVNWRKRRLDRLEATLGKFQTAMQTQLLYRVCKEQDAAIREQRLAINDTNATVRQLVAAYSSGQTNISLHIEKEATTIRDLVSSRTKKVEESLTAHVTQSSKILEQSVETINHRSSRAVIDKLSKHLDNLTTEKAGLEKRQRLLDSLRFAEMNGRINAVEDAHSGTFEWIFDDSFAKHLEESDYIFDDSSDPGLSSSDGNADVLRDSGLLARGGEDGHSDWATDNDSEANDSGVEDESYTSPPLAAQGWDDVTDWFKSESQLYWICGHPGSGKSTLVKFLVLHNETQNALHTWRPQVMVLHHFFWKPGTSMQNSIRGMLCTLIHQILSARTDALEFCAQQQSLLTKITCSDWSLKELRVLTFSLLKEFAPICIFVDGLDEAPELDYCRSLLDLLHSMASLSNVKLCAASRPEPVLKQRLELHPHLRLQDLTSDDMWSFVNAAFENERRNLGRKQRAELRSLAELLMRRAEGVFLWLRLAINDTLRDLAGGYIIQESHQRVGRLPQKLTALYHDMWSRLNTDKADDHRAGAEILNVVLISTQFADLLISKAPGEQSAVYGSVIYLPEMLALLDSDNRQIRPSAINFDERELGRQLQRMARNVKDRSAGLVDISTPFDETGQPEIDLIDATVTFIHRSAYDFLVDTTEGQKIRSKDTSSYLSRWLRFLSVLFTPLHTKEPAEIYYYYILHALIKFCPREIKQQWTDDQELTRLLDDCTDLFISGYFAETSLFAEIDREVLVCITMTSCPLNGWVHALLSRLPENTRAQKATVVLRHVRHWRTEEISTSRTELFEFHTRLRGDLLDLGASPYEYGPDLVEISRPDAVEVSHYRYCNAVTEMCIETIIRWRCNNFEQLWAEQSGYLDPVTVRKMLSQISSYGIAPEVLMAINFVQKRAGMLFLDFDNRPWNPGERRYSKHTPDAWGRTGLSLMHIMVVQVNLSYLVRAVAARAAYYQHRGSGASATPEDAFGIRFAQDQPHAVLRYIVRRAESRSRNLGRNVYKINNGPCSRTLLESITDLFHSRIRQSTASDSRVWRETVAVLNSDEAEETSESTLSTLAADRIGVIRRDDWKEEKAARARLQEEAA